MMYYIEKNSKFHCIRHRRKSLHENFMCILSRKYNVVHVITFNSRHNVWNYNVDIHCKNQIIWQWSCVNFKDWVHQLRYNSIVLMFKLIAIKFTWFATFKYNDLLAMLLCWFSQSLDDHRYMKCLHASMNNVNASSSFVFAKRYVTF